MDILQEILKQVSTKDTLSSLGESLDATPSQIKQATQAIVPALLNSMSENTKTEKGLESLFGALTDHQNDNVSDISGFLGGLDMGDASKMVGHILGDKSSSVQKKVAKDTGMSSKDIGSLITMLAPLLMGLLGNQKKNKSGFDVGTLVGMLGGSGDITSLLGGLLGGSKPTPKKTAAGKAKTTTSKKVTSVKSNKKQSNDILDSVTDLLGSLMNKK